MSPREKRYFIAFFGMAGLCIVAGVLCWWFSFHGEEGLAQLAIWAAGLLYVIVVLLALGFAIGD